MPSFLLPLVLLISVLGIKNAQSIGVCYGKNGNNLPSEADVVGLYKSNNIARMRIYHPDRPTLDALRGSNIELILGASNDQLQSLAENPSAASTWVRDNVVPYAANVKIKYIAVGNEVRPGDPNSGRVLPAMRNIQNAINSANLQGQIKVSTAIDTTLIGVNFPPSKGAFSDPAIPYIRPIIDFLVSNGAPLLANVYTYFTVRDDPSISLQYALFTSPGVVVTDGQFQYQNLFDAILDALHASLEKAGGSNLRVVVSESGWPSEGGNQATAGNAGTYYKNLIGHVNKGTPRRPGQAIETYLFAMFDENLKGAGVEQHFGLFRPDKQNKYGVTFG